MKKPLVAGMSKDLTANLTILAVGYGKLRYKGLIEAIESQDTKVEIGDSFTKERMYRLCRK